MDEYTFRGNEYSVDLVICIDGTIRMRQMIDEVKKAAKEVYQKYYFAMQDCDPPKAIRENHFRARVIVFRDFSDNSITPLEISRFYNFHDSADEEEFCRFVDDIELKGGENGPACALEAIATAIKTEWEPTGGRFRRQIILLFTSTCTYNLKNPQNVTSPNYPSDMPDDFEQLASIWNNGDLKYAPAYAPKNGRLIIYAPPHTEEAEKRGDKSTVEWENLLWWDRTWIVPIDMHGRCELIDLQQSLDVCCGGF